MSMYRQLRKDGAADERELISVDHRGDHVLLTLKGPERLNLLSAGLNLQLQQRLHEVAWTRRFDRWR